MVSDWQFEKPSLIKGFLCYYLHSFLYTTFVIYSVVCIPIKKLLITKLPILS